MSSDRFEASIIIPLYNRADLTEQCLVALARHTTDVDAEVILVDNASTDSTPSLCSKLTGDVVVIRNERNLGFAAACNQGAAAASSERLLFLNNDTEPHPGWLRPMLSTLYSDGDIGAVGSLLLFPDGTVQHAGVVLVEQAEFPRIGAVHMPYQVPPSDPAVRIPRDVAVVTGACMLIRSDVFFDVGGFDEAYWNGYEDVDLCLKLGAAGWRVRYEPRSVVTHHESASGPERFRREDANVVLLDQRWAGKVTSDIVLHGDDVTLNPEGILHRSRLPLVR